MHGDRVCPKYHESVLPDENGDCSLCGAHIIPEDNINNIIPAIFAEMESDGENESEALLRYFLACNAQERAVVDNVLMYLCGWTFATLLAKCGLRTGEQGELPDAPERE
jgi:hypothetical protein